MLADGSAARRLRAVDAARVDMHVGRAVPLRESWWGLRGLRVQRR